MLDLILENALVIDGSGRKPYNADIGILGKRIESIGNLKDSGCARRIDVAGLVACPGFIDVHSHADLTYFRQDHPEVLSPLVRQGITTFIGGNCGMCLAPITREHRDGLKVYLEVFTQMDFDKDVRWDSMGSFLDLVEKGGTLLNFGLLAPHGMLRISARGLEMGFANEADMRAMKRLLEECMEAGAFGMSTGLQYFPGNQSDTTELIELGRTLAKHDGIFTSHLRSYTASTLPQAIAEVATVASRNEIRGEISHLFSLPWFGPFHKLALRLLKNLAKHDRKSLRLIPDALIFSEMNRLLSEIRNHKDKGVRLGMDLMPTTAGFTHLLAFFPPWVVVGDRRQVMERISDRSLRKQMLRDIERGRPYWPHRGRNHWSLNIIRQMGWDAVTIMAVNSEKNKHLEGRRFTEIGEERGKHPFEVMCDLLLEEEGQVLVFESLCEPDDLFTEKYTFPALKDRETAIVTDTILLGIGRPSYLFYGCYPKFINRYVYHKKLLTLPEAIARCTSLPASHFDIRHRGLLKEGYYADLLVIDPENFKTEATFRNPEVSPGGLKMVIINGKVVLEDGALFIHTLPGMVLRKNDQTRPLH